MSATLKLWLALIIVFASLTASVVFLSRSLTEAREDLAGTSAQVQTLSDDLEALRGQQARVQAGINNLNQRSAENERRISNALRQNPEWAGQSVPDDVADGLCRFASCAPRGDSPGEM